MQIIKAACGQTMMLGVQGENLARAVAFDISNWVAEYGSDGIPGLLYKQSEAADPYPVSLERDGAVVRWPLTAYDMQTAGYGAIELRYMVGDVVVKSATWATWVAPSMTAGTPPEPLPDWVQAVLDAAIRAESWAVGGTGTRPGEDTNNAKYWAEVAQSAGGVSKKYVDQQDADTLTAANQYAGERGSCFAVCSDPAASPTSAPNKWYIPKTMPRPSGKVGMMIDVLWANGHEGGLGYDVSLIWGAPGGADNETIIDKAIVSDSLTGEYSIPTEGTVRYQLYEQSGRLRWQYVGGDLLPKQYSTDVAADAADKPVHGLQLAYLPDMEIYVQLDNGNTAPVMRLVPDEGAALPVYGNGTGAETGTIPAGYILHLANAGDHWQIINTPGSGGGGVTPEQLNEAVHTTLNVEIEDDGFGGYRADHNDAEINNHRNAGGIVQAKYYDSGKNQTYTYYYSTMESDRKPTFIRTYVNDDGQTVQVLVSVGNDKKVTVVQRPGVAVDPTLSKAGQAADAKVTGSRIKTLSEEKVTRPATGAVGQVMAVKSLDAQGRPDGFECVPQGGKARTVIDVTLTADQAGVDQIEIEVPSSVVFYNCKQVRAIFMQKNSSGVAGAFWFKLYIKNKGGSDVVYMAATQSEKISIGKDAWCAATLGIAECEDKSEVYTKKIGIVNTIKPTEYLNAPANQTGNPKCLIVRLKKVAFEAGGGTLHYQNDTKWPLSEGDRFIMEVLE